jgi:hypothetical protein
MAHTHAELSENYDERLAQSGASKSFDKINAPKFNLDQPLHEFSILDS